MAFGSRSLAETNREDRPQRPESRSASVQMRGGVQAVLNLWPRTVDARTPGFDRMRKEIQKRLTEMVGEIDTSDEAAARASVAAAVRQIISEGKYALSETLAKIMVDELVDDVAGFGRLSILLRDDSISEIMVNGPDRVFVEVNGEIRLTDIRFSDAKELQDICARMAERVGRKVDMANPVCDARTADGSRLNITVPPVAVDGPYLTVRKFRKDPLTLDKLVALGSLSPEAAEVVRIIGRSRCNVLVSGSTASGKTTLLNCLSNCVNIQERIVVCEDTSELQLQHPHYIRHETRTANSEGVGVVTMEQLVQNALRQRPDRIIVGEVRGKEAFHLLQAMNTGHSGSMGTIHANTVTLAIDRLEALVTMAGHGLPVPYIRKNIAGVIDVIIQTDRTEDGKRRITSITELTGIVENDNIQVQELFKLRKDEAGYRLLPTGIRRPRIMEKAEYFGEGEALSAALAVRS